MNAPATMEPRDVPREHDPLTEEHPNALGQRPAVGYWVMGLREPRLIWWRCPFCNGQIPIDPPDVNADGLVDDVVHSEQCKEGRPRCTWTRPLRLLDYDGEQRYIRPLEQHEITLLGAIIEGGDTGYNAWTWAQYQDAKELAQRGYALHLDGRMFVVTSHGRRYWDSLQRRAQS